MIARGIDPGDTIGWCDVERESAGVFRYVASGAWDAADAKRGCWSPADPDVHVYAIETPEEMHHNEIVGAIVSAEASQKNATRRFSRDGAWRGVAAARIAQKANVLLRTRALAERIACSLVAADARVIEPTATECRRALGVRFGAQRAAGDDRTVDQQIAALLPRIVRGWPKRSNVHVRDAAVCALYALGPAEVARAIGGAST